MTSLSAELPKHVLDALDERTARILERRRTHGMKGRGQLVRRALLTADLLGLSLAFLVAQVAFLDVVAGRHEAVVELSLFLLSLPCFVVAATLYGLYDRDEERTDHSTSDDFSGLFHLVTFGAWSLYACLYFAEWADPRFPKLFAFWLCAIVFMTLWRVAARTYCRRHIDYLQNALIVGAGDVGQLVARKLLHHPEYGINLVGFVDDRPKARRDDLEALAIIGVPDDLADIVRLLDVERVIVAFSNEPAERELELIRSLDSLNVQIDVIPRLFHVVTPTAQMHTVEGLPVLSLGPARISRLSRLVKRGADVVVSSAALLLLAPFFLFVAWRIKRDSPGPVFFRQKRLGMHMNDFTVLKFRTMVDGTPSSEHEAYIRLAGAGVVPQEANGLFKLDRSEFVTKTGKWLRRTSLDELPQLFNVLRGDMSLVGPRPCLAYELDALESHHFERFDVRPGITGMWQVTARAKASFRDALDMDVSYVRGWSLGLDLRLLARTPVQLLRRGTR